MNHELNIECPEAVTPPSDEFELGTLLGRRQAFNVMAGKASVADIDCLRHIRDTRLYKCKCQTFDEFCATYLGASRAQVNKLIGYLDKYGPRYIALTQLTRVPPKVYEVIEPHLSEEGLVLDGETFALTIDNAQRVAAAVVELRQRAEGELRPPQKSDYELVEGRLRHLIKQVETLQSSDEEQRSLAALVERLAAAVSQPLAA